MGGFLSTQYTNNVDPENDTEVINIKGTQISNSDMKTPFDGTHEKNFVIYKATNGTNQIDILSVKLVEDTFFVYSTNISTKKSKLLYLAKISDQYLLSNLHDIMKYVQLSRNFKYLALPEKSSINIYQIDDFKYIDEISVSLINSDGKFKIAVDDRQNTGQNNVDLSRLVHQTGINNAKLHRCILFDNVYVVVLINQYMVAKLIFYFYNVNKTYEMTKFDIDLTTTLIRFSVTGRYMLFYNVTTCTAKLYEVVPDMGKTNPIEPIYLTILPDKQHLLLNVSEDGKFIMYGDNSSISIHDFSMSKTFDFASVNKVGDAKYTITDYSCLATENDKIYALIGWHQSEMKISFSIITCINSDYMIVGSALVNINIASPIDYTYSNGAIFVFRTSNGLTIFDISKFMPVRMANLMLGYLRSDLCGDITAKYGSGKYYAHILLVGADSSAKSYKLDYEAAILLDIQQARYIENVFKLNFASNVNIYDSVQSFTIFTGLLTGKLQYKDVIDRIFKIGKYHDNHVVMHTLIEHMLEYMRIFVCDQQEMRTQKLIYVGYVVVVLTLKYYLKLVCSVNETINKNILELVSKTLPYFSEFLAKSSMLMFNSN